MLHFNKNKKMIAFLSERLSADEEVKICGCGFPFIKSRSYNEDKCLECSKKLKTYKNNYLKKEITIEEKM